MTYKSDGSSVLFSGSCDTPLMNAFQSTYRPFLASKCVGCHSNGPGVGTFANANFQTAFNSFISLGRARVERNMLNAGHQVSLTGPQNRALIDNSDSTWLAAEAQAEKCASGGTGESGPQSPLQTLGKSDSLILTRSTTSNAWVRLNWDLDTELSSSQNLGKFKMIASIEVRLVLKDKLPLGYEFRNPSFKLKTAGGSGYGVRGIRIKLNKVELTDLTTYTLLSGNITSTTDTNIALGGALGFFATTEAFPADSFSLVLDQITVGPLPLDTPVPVVVAPLPTPTAVSYTQLISTNASIGVFGKACLSCHGNTNPKGGLNLASYDQAKTSVGDIVSRMNNSGNPMPPSGILSFTDRDLVRTWQTTGAPR